jgi:hypothetical protein
MRQLFIFTYVISYINNKQMKNLLIIAIIFTFFSCKKEEVTPDSNIVVEFVSDTMATPFKMSMNVSLKLDEKNSEQKYGNIPSLATSHKLTTNFTAKAGQSIKIVIGRRFCASAGNCQDYIFTGELAVYKNGVRHFAQHFNSAGTKSLQEFTVQF